MARMKRRKKPKTEPFLEHISPPARSNEYLSCSDLSEDTSSVSISYGGFNQTTVDLTVSPVKQPKQESSNPWSPVKTEFAVSSINIESSVIETTASVDSDHNGQSSTDAPLPVPVRAALSPVAPERPSMPSPRRSPTASQVNRIVCSELEQLLESGVPDNNLESSVDTLLPPARVTEICGKENTISAGYKPVKRVTLNDLELCTPVQRQSHGMDLMDSDSVLCEDTSDTDMLTSVPGSESSESDQYEDSQIVTYNHHIQVDHNQPSLPVDAVSKGSMEQICEALNAPASPVSFHSEDVAVPMMEDIPSQCSPPRSEPPRVFAFSMIDGNYKAHYYDVVTRMGAQVVENEAEFGALTHVVAGRLCRSSKFLAASAGGRWVLKTDYIEQCEREGRWCEEGPYEWCSNNCPSASASDLNLLNVPYYWRNTMLGDANNGPFSGMHVVLWVKKHPDILPVILTLGKAASVVGVQVPPYSDDLLKSVTHVLVEEAILNEENEKYLMQFKRLNVMPISTRYVAEKLITPSKTPQQFEIVGCKKK